MSTPNAPHPALTPRERFLRERQQRQNTTFSIIGVAMIAAAVLAALVFTGLLPIPFGNGFSEKIKYAEVGDVPCPTQSAKPVPPSQISVTVINTTQHAGLASKASDMLATAGFQMQEPDNAEVEYTGKVRITAGNAGALSYSLNGKDMGAIGQKGEVVEKTFTKENAAK